MFPVQPLLNLHQLADYPEEEYDDTKPHVFLWRECEHKVPRGKSRMEYALRDWLDTQKIEYEYNVPTAEVGGFRPDFVIRTVGCHPRLLEIDGPDHFIDLTPGYGYLTALPRLIAQEGRTHLFAYEPGAKSLFHRNCLDNHLKRLQPGVWHDARRNRHVIESGCSLLRIHFTGFTRVDNGCHAEYLVNEETKALIGGFLVRDQPGVLEFLQHDQYLKTYLAWLWQWGHEDKVNRFFATHKLPDLANCRSDSLIEHLHLLHGLELFQLITEHASTFKQAESLALQRFVQRVNSEYAGKCVQRPIYPTPPLKCQRNLGLIG
jgi:hypothetical protein